jgi:CRISPR-associated protein Csb3
MSFTANIDPCNPAQFFACCGLLDLASRLWSYAEGWFTGQNFHVTCEGSLDDLISRFAQAEISSSLSPTQLKRLGTLLSVSEDKLTLTDLEEKSRLKEMWKFERLHLSAPFDVWIDWWRNERGERTDLKTWAAKQMVVEMAQNMLSVIRVAEWSKSPNPDALFQSVQGDSLPFNFDSDLSGQGSARDTGFSADTLSLKSTFRPLLELIAFIGLQRFHPTPMKDDRFCFSLWSIPLPPSVAAAAATGSLGLPNDRLYEFALFSRTKYMKSFLPAQSQQGAK